MVIYNYYKLRSQDWKRSQIVLFTLQLLEHKLDKLLTSCVCIIEAIGNLKLASDAALLDLEFTKAAILAPIAMY